MAFIKSLLADLPAGAEESLVNGNPEGGLPGVILSAVSVRFRRPVEYPDTLLVGHRPTSIGKDRMVLESVCYSYQ